MNNKCELITIIGAPNAGKSTLTNLLVGSKVTICSPKAQTTRSTISGILVEDNTQLIFLDTPGIFKNAKKKLEKAIIANAFEQLKSSSKILFLVDIRRVNTDNNQLIINHLISKEKKVILCINKIDTIKDKSILLEKIQEFNDLDIAEEIFLISAIGKGKNDGIKELKKHLIDNAKTSPFIYPEDQITNISSRFLAQEITREKLFNLLNKEIPYNLSVETESWTETDDGAIRIDQVIYISRTSQKKIIIGEGGSLIKKIGTLARKELSEIFEARIQLYLHVKVKEDWLDKDYMYEHMNIKPV